MRVFGRSLHPWLVAVVDLLSCWTCHRTFNTQDWFYPTVLREITRRHLPSGVQISMLQSPLGFPIVSTCFPHVTIVPPNVFTQVFQHRATKLQTHWAPLVPQLWVANPVAAAATLALPQPAPRRWEAAAAMARLPETRRRTDRCPPGARPNTTMQNSSISGEV